MNYTRQETLLKAEGVGLVLGGSRILRNINLRIDNIVRPGFTQGQVVALLGPSGIGKTQLFKILAGLRRPTEGTVTINEHGDRSPDGLVGVVAQHYPLLKFLTVRGNLYFATRQRGLKGKDIRMKADEMLERFGLTERRDLYPSQLSGGQRQRLAIAQQLLCSEHFLLMDEPFSGLDVIMLENVTKLITEVASADELSTIIVVTHDVTAACTIADTIWLLGLEKDGEGKRIPGATVVREYDLIVEGLAWQPDLHLNPRLLEFSAQIKSEFRNLK